MNRFFEVLLLSLFLLALSPFTGNVSKVYAGDKVLVHKDDLIRLTDKKTSFGGWERRRKRQLHDKGHSLKEIYNIIEKDVEDGYQEYLLRIPVLLKEQNILDEGIFSRIKILKNLIRYQ